jgi:hypothetical protein
MQDKTAYLAFRNVLEGFQKALRESLRREIGTDGKR